MWDLRRRFRDPSTREVPSFTLKDAQFLLAARMQLGIGLAGVIEGSMQDNTPCTACRKGKLDRCGFHFLYSCHAQQGNRSKRHSALQRIYMHLAKSAGLAVSHYAPNVTSNGTFNNHSHSKKQEFADWQASDNGTTIVFDNSNIGAFTATARALASKPRLHGDLPRRGHSATYAVATDRRKAKYETKGPGCSERDVLFLPIINTHAGGFVPQDPVTLLSHTEAAKRVFGSDLANALGRVGTRPRSIEEGLIRRWARRTTDTENGGKGVFDATLSVDRAAGVLTAHTYRLIAHAALRSSANAATHALQKGGFSLRI